MVSAYTGSKAADSEDGSMLTFALDDERELEEVRPQPKVRDVLRPLQLPRLGKCAFKFALFDVG